MKSGGWAGNVSKRCPRGTRGRWGFTLVELLVVIAIIGILLALLIPAVQAARESSRRTACSNNMRQLGVGLHSYESANRKWPAGKKWSGPPNDPTSFALGWTSFLLEYIEEDALHNSINFKKPFTDPVNLPFTTKTISVYLCPSTSNVEEHRTPAGNLVNLGGIPGEGLGCIDYMGVSGPDKDTKHPVSKELYGRQRGVLIGTKGLPQEDELDRAAAGHVGKDHRRPVAHAVRGRVHGPRHERQRRRFARRTAWRVGLGRQRHAHRQRRERLQHCPKCWHNERIHSDHPGGAHILMCDSSVHFFTDDTDKKVIRWMASRDGEEELSDLTGE